MRHMTAVRAVEDDQRRSFTPNITLKQICWKYTNEYETTTSKKNKIIKATHSELTADAESLKSSKTISLHIH